MTELEVEIYGKKYTLRGTSPEEVRAVAKLMDQRMRELFGAEPKALDVSKALALAINFAEELGNLKRESDQSDSELCKKVDQALAKVAQLEKIFEL